MSDRNEPRDLLDELETLQRVLDDAASDQVDQKIAVPSFDGSDDTPVLNDMFSNQKAAPLESEPPLLKPEAPALKAVPVAPNPVTTPHAETRPQDDVATTFDPLDIADLIGQNLDHQNIPSDSFIDLEVSADLSELGSSLFTDAEPATKAADEAFNEEPPILAEPAAPVASEQPTPLSTPISSATVSNNPFLPQAILDRLAHERKAALFSAEQAQQTIAKINSPATKSYSEATQPNTTTASVNAKKISHTAIISELEKAAIIDELVMEMLPEIETKLRKILADKL